jgi:CxxC motif-containing protein
MKTLYCINCPNGCLLKVYGNAYDMTVEGNNCNDGYVFAETELKNPTRTLTTTVRTKFPGVPVLSVRTDGEIPKGKLMDAVLELSKVIIEVEMDCGDTVLEDVSETGVRVIVTSPTLMQLGAELENKNAELGRSSSSGSDDAAYTGTETRSFGGSGIPVLDNLGAEAAGGFVGAAGEAVGVEATEEEPEDITTDESGNIIKQKSRPHIKRR